MSTACPVKTSSILYLSSCPAVSIFVLSTARTVLSKLDVVLARIHLNYKRIRPAFLTALKTSTAKSVNQGFANHARKAAYWLTLLLKALKEACAFAEWIQIDK